MGCRKLTYYPETCVERSRNAERKTVNAKKELTLKKSSESVCSSYLFGFNGKENDNEVKGEGNSLDFGARIYDSRLGRWLALDPMMTKYPSFSPYAFCANNPILFIDPDGKKIANPNDPATKAVKAELLKTKTGRQIWNHMASSKTSITIKITDDVLVTENKNGTYSLNGGQYKPTGDYVLKKGGRGQGEGYYTSGEITISKGTFAVMDMMNKNPGMTAEDAVKKSGLKMINADNQKNVASDDITFQTNTDTYATKLVGNGWNDFVMQVGAEEGNHSYYVNEAVRSMASSTNGTLKVYGKDDQIPGVSEHKLRDKVEGKAEEVVDKVMSEKNGKSTKE
jgi:RHS repeat-associated protein